jgi:hypothetical protein
MTAAAHPTPAVTRTAPEAQFLMHAPHSMHDSRSAIEDFPSIMRKTAWGQTSIHCRQPRQSPWSSFSVSPFFR